MHIDLSPAANQISVWISIRERGKGWVAARVEDDKQDWGGFGDNTWIVALHKFYNSSIERKVFFSFVTVLFDAPTGLSFKCMIFKTGVCR